MKLNIDRILYEMDKLKWNPSRLARETGVSRQAVLYWLNKENGHSPRLGTIQKIADALNVEPKDLIK